MQARAEVTFAFAVLLSIQVLTSFGAIGLLSRMSPAIGQILRENVASLVAVEDMLVVLAATDAPREVRIAQFEQARARAGAHVTMDAEEPGLRVIDGSWRDAIDGDPAARRRVLRGLEDLAEVNRASMRASDAAARQLGTAGAWGAVVLGVLAFGISVVVVRRLLNRVTDPLEEVDAVLREFLGGQGLRRTTLRQGPAEIVRIGQNLDQVLDHHGRAPDVDADRISERRLLVHLLDRVPEPVFVLDQLGAVYLVNPAAEALLHGPRGPEIRERLSTAARRGARLEGWRTTDIEAGRLRVYEADDRLPSSDPPAG